MRYLTPLTALLIVLALTGCQPEPTTAPGPGSRPHRAPATQQHPHDALTGEARLTAKRGPRLATVNAEPRLRIRIGRSLTRATVGQPGRVTVGPGPGDRGKTQPRRFQAPLRVTHDKQGFILTQPDGTSLRWRLTTLVITSPDDRTALDNHPYPGGLHLVAERSDTGQPTGRFDAVNHVGMEAYLPGVLSKELYPGWDEEAYRAQAIAARSYAIWEMNLPMRRAGHYDLEASQASQAYIGGKASDKARRAVAATRGRVLVYGGRVLPAFYSSCSGGVGQDAVAAWPGKVDDLAPLRGRSHGNWGRISSKYQWGPIVRDRASLSRRIAAWGRAEEHPVAAMGTLAAVRVSATNSAGRPTKMRLTDERGRTYELFAEELRMAANFRVSGLPPIDMSNMVYASNLGMQVAGNQARITGRGFGHGVGLCQFGAQHMATQGYRYPRILGFYYPGAILRTVY